MLTAEEKNRLIEAYLTRVLSDEDRLALEESAKGDPLFFKELVDTQRAMSLLRIENSIKTFQTIYDDNVKKPSDIDTPLKKHTSSINRDKHKFITNRHLLIAASVTLALVISVTLVVTYNTNTQAKLLSEFFEPYPNIVMPLKLGVADQTRHLKEQAYEAYENRNYASAISFFEKVNSVERDPYATFYLGISYLARENGERAIKEFTAITNTYNDFPLLIQTKWYLGLSYLEVNKIEEAKHVFNDLVSHDSIYKEKAGDILKTLN